MRAMRWTHAWVLAALLAPASARADEPPWDVGVSAAARDEARRLRDESYPLLAADRFDDAIAKLQAALALYPHPKLHLALGLTYMRLSRWLEAEPALQKALATGEAGLDKELTRTQAALAEVAAHLGTVVVTGKQPRAELSVDGKRVLVAPGTVSIRVLPGRHVVIATRGTLSSEPVALDVRPGDTLDAAPLLYVTETAWRWSRWKPWAVIGTGAAVAIAGVPMLVHSRSEYDRYQAQFNIQCRAGCPSEPAGLVAIKDNAQTWRYTAIGAFVGGGVLAGLGLAWLALNHPVDTRRVAPDVTTTIVPWRGGTGLTVARTW